MYNWNALNADSLGSNILARFYNTDGTQETSIGSSFDKILALYGQSIIDKNNKKFLVQGSVTAGSDNLLITETTDGVQITCNAPTNAQIEALQRLINDLSTKIDNLTNRVVALETQIDGGIA